MTEEINVDSELVIACHCEIHEKLYYVNRDNKLDYNRPIGSTVDYIDPNPNCIGATWDKIATESKTYVWAFNCPILLLFTHAADKTIDKGYWYGVFLSLIKNAYRVLRVGGKFIIPIPEDKVLHLFSFQTPILK